MQGDMQSSCLYPSKNIIACWAHKDVSIKAVHRVKLLDMHARS